MLRPILAPMLGLALTIPGAALAQDEQAQTGQPPQRVRSVTLKPGETCPKSSATEVVVCGTLDNPYRIPKGLRDDHPIPAQNQAWTNRMATVDQVGRTAGGLPDTCSAIGSGGQTGCAAQAAKNWVAEKTAERRAASSIP